MLTTSESLNLCDLYKIDMPQEIRDQQKSKSIKQAFKLLISSGYLASDIQKLSTGS